MNRKTFKLVFFAIVTVAMFAAPAFMARQGELVLRHGSIYLFKAAPMDPYDYFRGRYVNIRLEQNYAPAPSDKKLDFKYNEPVCAVLKNGGDGFACFDRLSRTPPEDGDYVKVHFSWQDKDKAYLLIPFNQVYMNEHMAPEAERAVRDELMKRNDACVLKLRVYRGAAAVEELLINSIPARQYLQAIQARKNKK